MKAITTLRRYLSHFAGSSKEPNHLLYGGPEKLETIQPSLNKDHLVITTDCPEVAITTAILEGVKAAYHHGSYKMIFNKDKWSITFKLDSRLLTALVMSGMRSSGFVHTVNSAGFTINKDVPVLYQHGGEIAAICSIRVEKGDLPFVPKLIQSEYTIKLPR